MRAASGAGPEPSPAPRQRMHFTAEASHAALAYAGPEFVLYAVRAPAGSSTWVCKHQQHRKVWNTGSAITT